MKSRACLVLALALAMGAAVTAAPARAVVTLGVAPALVEITGNAGGKGSVELSVFNQGDESFDVTIESLPFERVEPALAADEWLRVEPSTVHLEPGASQTLVVTVAIPDGQPSGGRYAVVSLTTGATSAEGAGASISGRLLVPFLITAKGEGKLARKATIERFAPVLDVDGRIGFRAVIANEGNIHWKAGGEAIVETADGEEYGRIEFLEQRSFPGADVLLESQGTLPLPSEGSFLATVAIDYGAKKPKRTEAAFSLTPNVSFGASVCENLDRGPTLTTEVVNAGDLGVLTRVTMIVSAADGQQLERFNPADAVIAWPNETTPLTVDLNERLVSGDYVLEVLVEYGGQEPVSEKTPFAIGGSGPTTAPLCPEPNAGG